MRSIKFLAVGAVIAAVMAVSVDAQADTGYFRELSEKKVTYLKDGVYAACLLLGVADKYSGFESQKAFLKEQGVLPLTLSDAGRDEILRKSGAAYIFCKALNIKGGVLLHVFASSERYALRELVSKKLVSDGPGQEIVSGKELLSILMRASEYKAEKE